MMELEIDNGVTIRGELNDSGNAVMEVEPTYSGCTDYIDITKDEAVCIISHLCNLFDIEVKYDHPA